MSSITILILGGCLRTEPAHQLGNVWHIGRVLFEDWWLAPYGIKRDLYKAALTMGAKAVGMPATF